MATAESIKLEGLNNVKEMLAALGPGLEAANERAQNKMAYELMLAEREHAKAKLDRPTSFTISSIVYKKYGASSFTVGDLTVTTPDIPGAGVFVGDLFKRFGANEEHYFGVQIFGGKTAGPRASELRLQEMGMMPRDKVWVPASGVGLDSYGNVKGTVIQKMLAELMANGRKAPNFVVLGKPGQETGIYTKVGEDWFPFLAFVDAKSYSGRVDFYEKADSEVQQKFTGIFNEAIDSELAKL